VIAVDTNVLVRLIVADDGGQGSRAAWPACRMSSLRMPSKRRSLSIWPLATSILPTPCTSPPAAKPEQSTRSIGG
jgi:hypothetical protein